MGHPSLFAPLLGRVAGLSFTARIERPPLYRGGSASTETMPAVSHSHSKLANFFPKRVGLG
jgi:hypothetical protein